MPDKKIPGTKNPRTRKAPRDGVVDLGEYRKGKPELSQVYKKLLREIGDDLEEMAITVFERAVQLVMAGKWKEWSDSAPVGTEAYIDEGMLRQAGDPAVAHLLDIQERLAALSGEFAKAGSKKRGGRTAKAVKRGGGKGDPEDAGGSATWSGSGQEAPDERKASCDDMIVKPLPRMGRPMAIMVSFSPEEYELMCKGHRPTRPDDEWFVFEESDIFYFYRAKSGDCACTIEFRKRAHRFYSVEAWSFSGSTAREDRQMVTTIRRVIYGLLLGDASRADR
jgi:hypothetical protein